MSIAKTPSSGHLDLLRRIPGLTGRNDRDLARLARHVEETAVEAGTVLIEEGTDGRHAYVIIEGWAAVTVHGEPVAALGPGQFVGEMALLDHGPRTASVVAKTAMRLLTVAPDAFDALVGQADVARSMARGLSERLRELEEDTTRGGTS
jgi:CRP-like cAMP-binding protein